MRDNNEIIKIIKDRMETKKLSLSELSRRVDMAKSAVSRYLNETREFPLNRAEQFSKALDLRTEYLLGFDNEVVKPIPVKPIPIVSRISAGDPNYSEEDIEEYTYVPENMFKVGKDLFALRVSGDSMDKEFKENDLVIIEKDSVVENGQIGVVMINGYSATVKRVRYEEDKIYLVPESNNGSHLTQVYTSDDEVYIIGKVVSSQKFY